MNNDCIYLFGFIPLNETDECFRRRMAQRRARLNDLYGTNRQRQQIEADRQLDLRGLDAARDVELADRGLNPDATDQVALTELRNLLTGIAPAIVGGITGIPPLGGAAPTQPVVQVPPSPFADPATLLAGAALVGAVVVGGAIAFRS